MSDFSNTPPPSSSDLTEKEQQEKNINWLKANQPHISDQIEETKDLYSTLIRDQEKPINIKIGHFSIYPENSENFLKNQIDDFIKNPIRLPPYRIRMVAPKKEKTSLMPVPLVGKLTKEFSQAVAKGKISKPRELAEKSAGFFAVLGLGLGFHIDKILTSFNFINLYIFETQIENILHAARFHDFEIWDKKMKECGGNLNFFIVRNANDISHYMNGFLCNKEHLLQCGSYIFRHLDNECFKNFQKNISFFLVEGVINKGFFPDELVMLKNSFGNLTAKNTHIILPTQKAALKTPLLIVANGPSLDMHWDIIKKHAQSHIIFSCGTALESLLKNDITPDFHCELENILVTSSRMQYLCEQGFDLKNIHTIFASTCVPELNRYFSRLNFFIRPSVTPTLLIKDSLPEMTHTLLTVLNTATSCAFHLGFEKIYLFGCDLGQKSDMLHSRDSIYYQENLPEDMAFLPKMNEQTGRFRENLSGNLGGKGHDNIILNTSRNMFEVFLQNLDDMIFFNCSDGIEIEGTIPMLGEMIPDYNEDTKKTDIESILSIMRPLNLKTQVPFIEKRVLFIEKSIPLFCKQLENIFNPSLLPENFDDMVAMAKKIKNLFKDGVNKKTTPARRALHNLFIGEVYMMIQAIFEIFILYEAGETRKKALKIVTNAAHDVIKTMRKQSTEAFEEIKTLLKDA